MTTPATFEELQAETAIERETLVVLEAARRLQGWTLHSGSVYKLDNFSIAALSPDSPVRDEDLALTAADDVAGVTAGKYYWDRYNRVLYLRTADSSHPNARYITCVQRLFFSGGGRKLPHDLQSGYDVHWLPFIMGTSDFGVGVDHVNQIGEAIDGSGSITLANDGEFWASRYEKLYFENQRVLVYAWSPSIKPDQARLIFKGLVTGKSYSPAAVTFKLQDTLYELRAEIPLENIGDIPGARVPESMRLAKRRLVYGRVYGHRPVNVDQVDPDAGYSLEGTVTLPRYYIDSTNNKLDFKESEGGSQVTASITPGVYTISQLSKELEERLNDAGGKTYLVRVIEGQWTIQTSGTYLELLAESGTNAATSILPTIGFGNDESDELGPEDSGPLELRGNEAYPDKMIGSGTSFLRDLSPDDEVLLPGWEDAVTIGSVYSDEVATLSEPPERSLSGVMFAVRPSLPSRYINRSWVLAGHALRQPETTIQEVSGPSLFRLASTRDLEPGADVLIGDEVVPVRRTFGDNYLRTDLNLETLPAVGTTVKRLAVSNVRINNRLLQYGRDYTFDATTATLQLDELAEFNAAAYKILNGTVSFVNGSRTVTGVDTKFTKFLDSRSWVKHSLQSVAFEVLEVISDEELLIRTPASYTRSGTASYKAPEIYDEGETVLSCDMLGATDDGTSSGVWLKTASQIVRDLLVRAGLEDELDEESFTLAEKLAPHKLGMVIPAGYSDKTAPKFREEINRINKAVFGELLQNADFNYRYRILSPGRSRSEMTHFMASDTLDWSIRSNSEKIAGRVRLNYLPKEYDPAASQGSNLTVEYQNADGRFLARSANVFELDTILVDERQVEIMAARWAFLFSVALSVVSLRAKVKAATLLIGDQIDLDHPKLFHPIGSSQPRKTGAVTDARKSGLDASIQFEDLANAFARCAVITPNDAVAWEHAAPGEKAVSGYFTDEYGSLDNDPELFGLNLIW